MTTVLVVASALAFFALLMASIALHELGHLIPGKLFGVRTTQYFVGFGKTLWSRHWGETEWGFKAIPLGGYVRLIGMYPPGKASPPGAIETAGPVTRLANSARDAEYEQISPADHGRLFYEKKTWQKLIIMAGGPAMNVLLAFGIFLGINLIWGVPTAQLTVAAVSDCIVPQTQASRTCTANDPATPALASGIAVGDTVVSFNGSTVTNWDQVSTLIRANGAQPATITVRRDGQLVQLKTVNTVLTAVASKTNPNQTVQAGFFGVTPTTANVKIGPVGTAQQMWQLTKSSVSSLVTFPQKVWHVAADLVTGTKRDPNGPISIVGASRVAGEIATVPGLSVGERIASWFYLLGSVNLFVALLNCVPLLPLDGGHIAGALYEGVKRSLARLLGRPDPGHVDTARMLPVAYAVGGFLLLSGVVLVLADLIDPIRIS